MKVNVSDLVVNKSLHKKIDLRECLENIDFGGNEFKFIEPVIIQGEMTVENQVFKLEGNIQIKVELNCDRCTKSFEQEMDILLDESFSNQEDSSEDICFFSGKEIELTNIIRDNIISNIPMKMLCSDDCEGLCDVCGCNKKRQKCSCKHEEYDPRLEALLKLKNNL